MIRRLLLNIVLLLGIYTTAKAQVTGVKYQLRYDDVGCKWAVYLYIESGSTTAVTTSRRQFNAQISVVLPEGSTVVQDSSFAPYFQNEIENSGNPADLNFWEYVPDVPQVTFGGFSFHRWRPNLSRVHYYNSLKTGDFVKLFTFRVNTPIELKDCFKDIRLYDVTVDPSSTELGGSDYRNGFTIGSAAQRYISNLPKETTKFNSNIRQECDGGIKIDLDLKKSTCQEPYTFQWSGPSGPISNNSEKLTVSNGIAGRYSVTVTDNFGCSKDTFVDAVAAPFAGNDDTLCTTGSYTLIGSNSPTGVWRAAAGTPSSISIGSTTNQRANVTFPNGITGEYKFIYGNSACEDTVKLTLITVDAGNDPASQECFTLASFSLNAKGDGEWVIKSKPGGASDPTFNKNDRNTTVSGFTAPGTYIFSWKIGKCTDDVTITILPTCPCTVVNTISYTPQQFCGTSGTINIDGNEGTPAGTYLWETSADGITWIPASGVNSNEDYTTSGLPAGNTYFRRKYINGGIGCDKPSNEVIVTVSPLPNAGTPKEDLCAEITGGVVTMNAVGSGIWSVDNKPNSSSVVNIEGNNNPTTRVILGDPGNYVLRWTVDGCFNTVPVTVAFKPQAGLRPPPLLCTDPGTRRTSLSGVGSGSWSQVGALPSPVTFTSSGTSNTDVINLTNIGTYIFAFGTPTCFDTLSLMVTNKADANGPATVSCVGSGGGEYLTNAKNGPGLWQLLPNSVAGGRIEFLNNDDNSAQTTIKVNQIEGAFSIQWTDREGCKDTLIIDVTTIKNAGSDQTSTCQVNAGDANFSLSAQGTGVWSPDISNPGTATISNVNIPNPQITGFSKEGVYKFIWTTDNNCKDEIELTVRQNPTLDPLSPLTCIEQGKGSYTMNANENGTWTSVINLGSAVIVNSSDPKTEIKDFGTPGTYIFRFTDADGCSSDVNLEVTMKPDAGADDKSQVCVDITSAVVSLNANGIGSWRAINKVDSSLIISQNDPRSKVRNFIDAGDYLYEWTSGGCTDTVVVTIAGKADAGADIDSSGCKQPNDVVIKLDAKGGPGIWRDVFNFGLLFTDRTSPTTEVRNFNNPGAYILEWDVNGCKDEVTIFINPPANAGPNPPAQTCFATASIILNAASSQQGSWRSDVGNPGLSNIVDPNNYTTQVNSFKAEGRYKFIWRTNSGCEDTVTVDLGKSTCICTIAGNTISTTSPLQYCKDTGPIAISGTAPTPEGGTFQWQVSINNGAYVNLPGQTSANYTTPALSAGIYNYRRVYTSVSCGDSSVPVRIIVANPPNAGGDYPLNCVEQVDLIAPLFTATPGVWRALDGGIVNEPNKASTQIFGFTRDGDYRVELEANGCRDTLKVIVKIAAEGGDDKNYLCADSARQVSFKMNAKGIGTWSKLSGADIYSISNPTDSLAIISGFSTGGLKKILWTKNNGCIDTVNLNLTVRPNAGPDIDGKCVTLPYTANMNAQDSGTWRSILSGVNFANPNQRNTSTSPISTAGIYPIEYSSNSCKDTVNIIVSEGVKINNTTSNVSCYSDGSLTLSASPAGGIWTKPISQTFTIENPTALATVIKGFSSAGSYKVYYTKAECKDSITVSVGSNCNCAISGNFIFPNTNVYCGISDVEINANKAIPAGGTTSWLLSRNNGPYSNIGGGNDTVAQIFGLSPGSYTVRKIYTITTCSDTTESNFIIQPKANAGKDTAFNCVTYPFSFKANATGNGVWSSSSSASIFNVNNPKTEISNITGPGTLQFVWNVGGCIDTLAVTTTLGVNAGRDTAISCVVGVASARLQGNGIGTWSQVGSTPSTAIISNPSNPITNINGLSQEGIYKFLYSNGSCVDTANIQISKEADGGPNKSINCIPTNGGYTDSLEAKGAGSWLLLSGPIVTLLNPNAASTKVLNIDSAGLYRFLWTAAAGCTDTVTWTVTKKSGISLGQLGINCNETDSIDIQSDEDGVWSIDLSRSAGTALISSPNSRMSMISKFSTKGKYYIIRTNSIGCTDTAIVDVDNRCACTINNNIISLNNKQFCKDQGNLRINGLSAVPSPGTYSWQTSRDSLTWIPAKGGNSGIFYEISIIDFPIGRHYFRRIYTLTSEGCFDTSNVISINILDAPSGGVNRSVLCWSKEFTNFTGVPGAGYRWEFLFSDPPGRTARILDPNLSTSRIDSFSGPAKYTFRWTNGICESNVVVTALDLCDISCNVNITGNRISPDTISECEKLQNFFFNGPTSSPTGGNYIWQVKQNGVYIDAPGQNTIEDYKPQILPVGQHSFRRLYQFGVCADTSNEIVVNILSTPTMPIISGPATVCEGSPINLSTPSVSGNSYRWSGPNGFISTQASLVIPSASILSNGEYSLIAGKGGCFSDTTRLNIKVIPRPKIPTALSNLPICDGQELVINVSNKQNGITYSISNNFNEVRNDTIYRKQNASMNDEGNYTILADSAGCKSLPLILNIKLNRPPIASIDKATIRCNEVDSVRLNVNETIGTWTASPSNPGTAVIGSGNNPVVKGFTTGGTYRFIWNNGGCTATVSVDVGISCRCVFPENVLIQPSPDFICNPTDTIVIRGRGVTNTTVNYKWQSTSDSLFSLASGVNNLKDYSPGLINKGTRFRRIMTLSSDSLCTDTSNVVFINYLDIKTIKPQLSVFNNPFCEGDTAQIRWLDPITFVKYKWTVSGNLTLITTDTQPSIKVRAQSGGLGKVSLSINDKTCNGVILDSQIVVGKIPQIYLGEDTTICSLDQTFNKYELKIDSFQNILWNTGSTSQNILVDDEGIYSVTVKNAEGCEATDSITILDFCCKIRYPNIIKLSSNNQNNSFNIDHTECVESSKLRIYDRWGNLIYQSNDVNDKWDGSFNGNAVEQGVYVFIFEYTYTDTNGLKANGKVTGDITVIR